MYPKQKASLFGPARYSITEASTKSGKTVGAIVWLTEQALEGEEGYNYWWIAPIYPQAKIAYRRLKRALPRALYTSNETELTITLRNGAVIWFKGSEHPDALYGEDVYAAVIDEATRCKEESWHAVRTTLTATRGPIRIIGNVKGRRNWAYRMARRAEAGEPNMSYHKITWRDAAAAGILELDEIEDARRQLPAAVFRELYEAEASDDEGNPFGVAAIRLCVRPLSAEAPVAYGVDLAKSHDYTVVTGLDKNGHVCSFSRYQKPWLETINEIKAQVGNVPALVDSTGVGDPILEALQQGGHINFEGFKFSSQSKQMLMEGLAVAVQRAQVGFPEGVIVNEMEQFEYAYTRTGVLYSAPEGMYDDAVCSLALAVRRATMRVPTQQHVIYDAMQLVNVDL